MATETQIEVVMPQMGVSVSEGTITKWLKQEGEPIARDESLLEISTDKVDTEVPSPGEGIVAKILVAGRRDRRGRHRPRRDRAGRRRSVRSRGACTGGAAARAGDPGRRRRVRGAANETAEPTAPTPAPEPAPAARPPRTPASGNGRTFVSPVVARIASEHGVDPNAVQGTGTGGRVTKKDILAFVEGGGQAEAAAPPAEPQAAPSPHPRPRLLRPRLPLRLRLRRRAAAAEAGSRTCAPRRASPPPARRSSR